MARINRSVAQLAYLALILSAMLLQITVSRLTVKVRLGKSKERRSAVNPICHFRNANLAICVGKVAVRWMVREIILKEITKAAIVNDALRRIDGDEYLPRWWQMGERCVVINVGENQV